MSAIDTVTQFLKAWEVKDGFYRSFEDYMTPGCVYENVCLSNTTGPAESIAMFKEMEKALPFATIGVDMLGIIGQGNTVMTERVDHIRAADGSTLISLRVMGVFVVEGGKISQWRDYFDVTPFRQ